MLTRICVVWLFLIVYRGKSSLDKDALIVKSSEGNVKSFANHKVLFLHLWLN